MRFLLAALLLITPAVFAAENNQVVYFTGGTPPANASWEPIAETYWAATIQTDHKGHEDRAREVGILVWRYQDPTVAGNLNNGAVASDAEADAGLVKLVLVNGQPIHYGGEPGHSGIIDLTDDATMAFVIQRLLDEIDFYRPEVLYLDDTNLGHSRRWPAYPADDNPREWTDAITEMIDGVRAVHPNLSIVCNLGGAGDLDAIEIAWLNENNLGAMIEFGDTGSYSSTRIATGATLRDRIMDRRQVQGEIVYTLRAQPWSAITNDRYRLANRFLSLGNVADEDLTRAFYFYGWEARSNLPELEAIVTADNQLLASYGNLVESQVGSSALTLWFENQIVTVPFSNPEAWISELTEPPGDDPLVIAAFADSLKPHWDDAEGGRQVRALLDRIPGLDIVLVAGDFGYKASDSWDPVGLAVELYGDAPFELFKALGNHEYAEDTWEDFLAAFEPPTPFAHIVRPPADIFIIDSERNRPEQQAWLEAELPTSTQSWRIAVFHSTPFSSANHGDNPRMWDGWNWEANGFNLILAGHDHTYEQLVIGNVEVNVVGLGGGGHYTWHDISPHSTFRFRDEYGVGLYRLYEDRVEASFLTHLDVEMNQHTILPYDVDPGEQIPPNIIDIADHTATADQFYVSPPLTVLGSDPLLVEQRTSSTIPDTSDWILDMEGNQIVVGINSLPEGVNGVQLKASNPFGESWRYFEVTGIIDELPDPPIASFTAIPSSGETPLTVAFSDTSSGAMSTWSWEFQGGLPSEFNGRGPVMVEFLASGEWAVNLVVEGPGGTDSELQTILVVDPPPPPPSDDELIRAAQLELNDSARSLLNANELLEQALEN
jgi:hypothetical protein